jgi:hypothetical protein
LVADQTFGTASRPSPAASHTDALVTTVSASTGSGTVAGVAKSVRGGPAIVVDAKDPAGGVPLPERPAGTGTRVRHHRGRRRRWRTARRTAALLVAVLLVPVGWSYAHALLRSGTTPAGIRTVEWVRDHGGNGLVNTIERWWYTNNPPPTGGRPEALKVHGTSGAAATKRPSTPSPVISYAPTAAHLPAPAGRVPGPVPYVDPNEGVWHPTGRTVDGIPAVYTTAIRPDAVHTSFYTGLMWIDTKLLRAAYVLGNQEPGGGAGPWGGQIPTDARNSLVAAFNSGFKMSQANGGAYNNGVTIRPLRDGAASLVIRADGTATVGMWGRDVSMDSSVVSVRQNLALMLDNGELNPTLRENDTNEWGATLGGNVYVWRSGVGIDANGALIYAGGNAMSIMSLARTLRAAGAVRAMELDINAQWVTAYTYAAPDASNPAGVQGTKLVDSMAYGGDRYLQPGERDFFAFFAAPKYEPVVTSTTLPPTTAAGRR